MLLCYFPVRSSGNCIFMACSTWSSWWLFPLAASIMFLSLASRPLFCKNNQASTGSGNRGGASSFSSTRSVGVTFHELSQFVFQEFQFQLDHVLELASELSSHSITSVFSTCSNSTWTKHWNLHQSIRLIPSLLPSDAREK